METDREEPGMSDPMPHFSLRRVDFGEALGHLQAGGRVRREGWNGKGMWLELQRPDANSKMTLPYIFMHTAQGHLVPWLASQSDLLSRDWRGLPEDDAGTIGGGSAVDPKACAAVPQASPAVPGDAGYIEEVTERWMGGPVGGSMGAICAERHAASRNPFKEGDVVCLRHGGIPMTVIFEDGQYVHCAWFDGQEMKHMDFVWRCVELCHDRAEVDF